MTLTATINRINQLVEISGASFRNRGAELMLAATTAALEERASFLEPAMDVRDTRFRNKARYGVHTFPPRVARLVLPQAMAATVDSFLADCLPTRLARTYGIARTKDCIGLLDVSGYSFGDRWGANKCNIFAAKAKGYKRHGKPVVLLPQMFGPFGKKPVADAFVRLARYVDVLFARDQQSYRHLLNLEIPQERVRLCPDITIGYKVPELPVQARAVVVPNEKMVSGRSTEDCERYLSTLLAAIAELQTRSLPCVILVHDTTGGDAKLAKEIQMRHPGELEVVTIEDARAVKQFLGAFQLAIASRFHAVVSALSQGVPTVTLGWTFKYEELLRDAGVEELLVDINSPTAHADIRQRVSLSLDEPSRADLCARLSSFRENSTAQLNQLWDEVFSLLVKAAGAST